MQQYHDLVKKYLKKASKKETAQVQEQRAFLGIKCALICKMVSFVDHKKVHIKYTSRASLFLQGSTNIAYLAQNKVRIWDDWPYAAYSKSKDFKGEDIRDFAARVATDSDFAKKWGELGPVYGYQWRSWPAPDGGSIDQISQVIDQIKNNPNSRRIIVNAWNVGYVDQMALPPCHAFFQFYVADGKLSCQLYQRSADIFLGVPFNIASYAFLVHMVAQVCGLEVGDFVHTLGDAHIYNNHINQVKLQLSRDFRSLPNLK